MEESDHQSAALIGSNDDILTEILVRLPVTSILRFKSVCKQWRLLLSHKHFTLRYDNNFSKSPGYFARNIYVPFDVENRNISPFRAFDSYFNRSYVRLRQSCNGLLLCYTFYYGAREYYVFNPTTKQLAIIPSLPKNIRAIALAYHQTHCGHYKVVCICDIEPVNNLCRKKKQLSQIHVYSSDSKKWKICVKSFSVPGIIFDNSVYCNGAVYWPSLHYLNRIYFYFKIDDERLRKLPLPEGLVDDDELMYFGESRGHLHLILRKDQEQNILTYEMLMDRSGWFVRYQVELDVFRGHFPKYHNFKVIDVVRGKEEEEEETFLVICISGDMIIRYNVHDKSFSELFSSKSVWDFFMKRYGIHRYIETLTSF